MSAPEFARGQGRRRTRFGVRARTLLALAVLLAVLLATSAALVVESSMVLKTARRAETSNVIAGDLIRAAIDLAVERGITNGLLASPAPAGEAALRKIAAHRKAWNKVFPSLVQGIADNPESLSPQTRAELAAAADVVDALRDKADVEIQKSFEARDPETVEAWLPAMSEFLEVTRRALGELSAPVTALDAEMQVVLEARMAAFDLRNAAGERAALISAVLGKGVPVSGPGAVLIGSRREATELNWNRLLRLTSGLPDLRIEGALDGARREYFGRYLGLVDEITTAGLGAGPYPVDLATFTEATYDPLGALDELAFATQSLAADMLAERARRAELQLYASLAAAIAGSLVAGFMVIILNRRVLSPIERITEAMRRLAAGSAMTPDLPVAQRDEIGDMSRAIAAFRDGIIASEAALLDAERFTHETIDALASHIAVLDERGIIIATNKSWRQFARQSGGPRAAYEGQSYLAVCDRAAAGGDAAAGTVAAGIRAVIAGRSSDYETEYPCAGPAAQAWFRMRVSRFAVPGPVRLVVVHDDITGRKLAEDRLREKNRLLELAEEMSRTGHWRLDLGSNAMRWSSEIYRIYGRSPAEFAPDIQKALAPYHPDDRKAFIRAAAEAIRSGQGFNLDLRLFRSDGQMRSVEVMAACEKSADGRVAALFGVFRDISERKKVEERLADINVELERRVAAQTAKLSARESYLRGILDNVAEIVMTVDADNRIESFNPAAERALGYAAVEVIGRNIGTLIEDPASAGETDAAGPMSGPRMLHGLDSTGREVIALCRDGTRMPAEITVADMKIDGGRRFIVAMRDITERKRSERALLEQATLLGRAQDLARAGHWSWRKERERGDWHTGIQYSAAAAAIFGVAPETLVISDDEYIARYVYSEDRARVAAAYRDYQSGRRELLEYRIVRPDGSLRHIVEVTEGVTGDPDNPNELLGMVQDITEHRQAEMALRDSETRLRAIFDHAPVTISLRDVDGRYIMVNRRFQEIFGLPLESIIGRTPQQFYPARFVDEVSRAIDEVRRRKSPVVSEEGAPTIYGDRRYLTTRFPIVDDTGWLVSIGSISVDVTEQRSAEAALRESEARLRAIYESEPECVALLADDGSLLEFNPAGLAMVEASRPSEILGRQLGELIEPGYRQAFRDLVERVYAGGSGSLLFELVGLAGTRRWLEMNAVPLRNPEGTITAMLGIARDVTTQRDMEEQLRQAQKMEAVGQLTGGIAHDFNNLLGVIVGNLDLLSLKLARHSRERELVERAVSAAERGGALTQRLLAFARRQTLLPQHVNPGALVSEVSHLLRRTLGERIDLNVEIDPSLMSCYVDPGQLETALLNLAINARDAMPEGGTMTISAVNATVSDGAETEAAGGAGAAGGSGVAPGRYVVISVADTGEGMNEETRARAFEPFFTTKGVGKGSGLGLSMVYGFVQQSGGHVRLDSEPGRGTVVSLFLKVSEPVGRAEAVGPSEPAKRAVRGGGQVILVVEDDTEMRSFAVDALNRLGYRTVEAANAADALSALGANANIAALFTDVMLPGAMDGFMLAEKVREARPEIPVLYTSGYADSARIPRELLTGEVELLPKPYRITDLGLRLERLLKREPRPVG